MANANDLRPGMTVRVTFDSEHRDERDAKIRRVPPFTEKIAGEERDVTDKVEVVYPNTTGRMTLMGDMRERVELEHIHLK